MWYIPQYNNAGNLEKIASSSNSNKTNEQATNHTFYPTIGLIAALTMSPVLGLGCRNPTRVEEPTHIVAPRDYTFNDLKAALGAARWHSLDNEQKAKFEDEWGKAKDNIKRFMVEVYNDPEGMYNSLSKDEQKRLDAFEISDLGEEKVNEYKKAFPWMDTEKLTLADKLFIDGIELGAYLSGLR